MEEKEKQPFQREIPTKAWQCLVNIHSALVLALALVVAALVCFSCALSRELEKDKGRISEAVQGAQTWEWRAAEAEEALEQGQLREAVLVEQLAELQKEADFWSERAVLVTKTGEKYHTYGCSVIREDTEVSVLDMEVAAAHGYTPCGLCHPEGE